MRNVWRCIYSGLLMSTIGLAQDSSDRAAERKVSVVIKNAQGQTSGEATFSPASPRGVKLDLDIQNLPPGEHMFHIHQKPVCDPAEDFDTAGLQFDPTGAMYGDADHKAHSGPAAGDPHTFVKIGPEGKGRVSVVFPELTLGDDKRSIVANGGRAIVFHAADGAAGPTRIACGIIRR